MKGFSPRNLKYMRTFAKNYPGSQFVQEALAQITWYHNIAIFEKVKESVEREWYISKTVEHGWSRNILVHQIDSGLSLYNWRITIFPLLPPPFPLTEHYLSTTSTPVFHRVPPPFQCPRTRSHGVSPLH